MPSLTCETDAKETNEGHSTAPVAGNAVARTFFYACGVIFLGFGFVGAVLPLMPTTVFFILSAGCFARSSPTFEAWIMNHPHFGPHVRDWRAHGAIARSTKRFAIAGISISFFILAVMQTLSAWGLALVAAGLSAVAAYILSRPEPPGRSRTTRP